MCRFIKTKRGMLFSYMEFADFAYAVRAGHPVEQPVPGSKRVPSDAISTRQKYSPS